MDLIATDGRVLHAQRALNIQQLLAALQFRAHIKPAKPSALSCRPFDAKWIGDGSSEHLKSAAHTQQFSAVAQVALQVLLPAMRAQPVQVGAHVLRAWQNHQIGRRRTLFPST